MILDTSPRFGLDTEWNQWIEQTGNGHDTLSTGDFNLIYRFAQHERIQFRTGLGINWLADSQESDIVSVTSVLLTVERFFPAQIPVIRGHISLGLRPEAALGVPW